MLHLRNIRGTFAAEGMTISKSTRSNLERIAIGQRAENPSVTCGDSSPFRGAFGARHSKPPLKVEVAREAVEGFCLP